MRHTRAFERLLLLTLAGSWGCTGPAGDAVPVTKGLDWRAASRTPSTTDVLSASASTGSSRLVPVIVQLEREPLAVLRAQRADGRLSLAEQAQQRAAIAVDQAELEQRVEALGGRVDFAYQNVYDGLALRVPSERLPDLGAQQGVVGMHLTRSLRKATSHSVPFVGAPLVWQGAALGQRGEQIKVAVVDTGIDFTHADFGGPGTLEAFQQARATSALEPEPSWFGPLAARIKGGVDLVGDDYDSDSDDPQQNEPRPDTNPLDCDGHGTHVAGIIGGSGVTIDGATYAGDYDADTFEQTFRIAPGVAPRVDLYAVRVLGCTGSVSGDVIVAALEWAADNEMDVVNLSLGASFGSSNDPDAVAARNLVRTGVTVVASAGNSGDIPYVTDAPANGDGVLSTAALDAQPRLPGARLDSDSGSIEVLNANQAQLVEAQELRVVILGSAAAVGLGCDPADYGPEVAGALVVTQRGDCDRIDRAKLGQTAGAAAVAMINSDAFFPPFEGDIEGVTIPFFGVRAGDAATLLAARSLRVSALELDNPGYLRIAGFSSAGPRPGDSRLEPSLAAPGVSVVSAGAGSGNRSAVMSGTSQASPVVAGLAALTRQAHPGWNANDVATALANTSDPRLLLDYSARRAGAGVARAEPAARTQVTLGSGGQTAVNFGFLELSGALSPEQSVQVRNDGTQPATFVISLPAELRAGLPHTASAGSSIRVAPGESASFPLRLGLPAPASLDPTKFNDVSGVIELLPGDPSCNDGISLRLPYYGVLRPVAQLQAALVAPSPERPQSTLTLSNPGAAIAGHAEVFAWGIASPNDGIGCNDLRAVGVRATPAADDRTLIFAIHGWRRCSSFSANEYDLTILNQNGDEYAVVGIDRGWLEAGGPTGEFATAVTDAATGEQTLFGAIAPNDSSVLYLMLPASAVGVSAEQPQFSYSLLAFGDLEAPDDAPSDVGVFDAYADALAAPELAVEVAPDATRELALGIDFSAWAATPAQGVMVTLNENPAGPAQVALFPVPLAAPAAQVAAQPQRAVSRRASGHRRLRSSSRQQL